MRNFFISLSIICLTIFNFLTSSIAGEMDRPSPGDIRNGESVFTANCSACHAGGNNVIMPDKTLKKDALSSNQMDSMNAITYQVTNGKNAMPAFGGRLSDSEIEDVASFVLDQSQRGWN